MKGNKPELQIIHTPRGSETLKKLIEIKELGEQTVELKVNSIYRGKNPRPSNLGFSTYFNDRQIIHIGFDSIQYDSPTVKNGQHYKTVSKEKFLKWVGLKMDKTLYTEGNWIIYLTK